MVHYWFDMREIQKNNKLTDEQRRTISDTMIKELHKEFPEILKWNMPYGKGDNGKSPYIELNQHGIGTDEKGAPLVWAIRRMTHSPNCDKIAEFSEKILDRELKKL